MLSYEKRYSLPSKYSSSFPDLVLIQQPPNDSHVSGQCSRRVGIEPVRTKSLSSTRTARTTTTTPSSMDPPKLKSSLSGSNLMDSSKSRRRTTSASASAGTGIKRNVSFGTLNIREYERTLGDHPDVTSGPPLALGWEYREVATGIQLVEYEDFFAQQQQQHLEQQMQHNLQVSQVIKGEIPPPPAVPQVPRRRSFQELRMPASQRRSILFQECGVSRAELQDAMREITKIKNSRLQSRAMPANARAASEVLESAVRKFKRLTFRKISSQAEQTKLWKKAKEWALERAAMAEGEKASSSACGSDETSSELLMMKTCDSMLSLAIGMDGLDLQTKQDDPHREEEKEDRVVQVVVGRHQQTPHEDATHSRSSSSTSESTAPGMMGDGSDQDGDGGIEF